MKPNLYLLCLSLFFSGCNKKKLVDHKPIQEEPYKSVKELKIQHQFEKSKNQVYSNKVIWGNQKTPFVTLTFDGSPHPIYTPQVLELLDQHQIKGTFFIVGKTAEKYPELVKAIQNKGHLIANHTYNDINLTKISINRVKEEWQSCNEIIEKTTGSIPLFCRPPKGYYNQQVIEAAKDTKLTLILWTLDPQEEESGSQIDPLNKTNNGNIVLIRDGTEKIIQTLKTTIQQLESEKYQFVDLKTMVSKK